MTEGIHYKDAGVDIAAGEEAVHRIKDMVRSTFSPSVLTDLGKFSGFYALKPEDYDDPVLVSSIDGVGTKLKVAVLMNKHDTVGEDLVNHCVNDILVGGAKPLFFLDYIGTGMLSPDVMEKIITGMVRGCRTVGCSLVGGEMAEMPGFYQKGDYDVAGCIVGIVDKGKIIDGRSIQSGDVLLGLSSNGLHTNGYSLARKVLLDAAGFKVDTTVEALGRTVGEELLRVHRCYFQPVHPLLSQFEIRGMSHVTGGGLVGNTRRMLPEGLGLEIDWDAWETPPIFRLLQEKGNVPIRDMRRTFNMGIGYVLIVAPGVVHGVLEAIEVQGEAPVVVGKVV